jgi:hypothetical protein
MLIVDNYITTIAVLLFQWLTSLAIISIFQISVDAEQIRIELEPRDKAKSLGTIQQTRRQKMQQK